MGFVHFSPGRRPKSRSCDKRQVQQKKALQGAQEAANSPLRPNSLAIAAKLVRQCLRLRLHCKCGRERLTHTEAEGRVVSCSGPRVDSLILSGDPYSNHAERSKRVEAKHVSKSAGETAMLACRSLQLRPCFHPSRPTSWASVYKLKHECKRPLPTKLHTLNR